MGLLLKKKKLKYNHVNGHTPTEKKAEAVIWRISLRRKNTLEKIQGSNLFYSE